MAQRIYGQVLDGPTMDGKVFRAGVFNELQVQASAGITMALGAYAFIYANWAHHFWPIRIVTTFFAVDFFVRVAVGLQYSPVGIVAGWLARRRAPEWVSAKPKRFAWSLGFIMSLGMSIITNVHIHGVLPRTVCLVCLTLMWLESVLGLCLGCELYAFMVRRGWRPVDEEYEVCVGGVCQVTLPPQQALRVPGTSETLAT